VRCLVSTLKPVDSFAELTAPEDMIATMRP
jgi:hypothetical protein